MACPRLFLMMYDVELALEGVAVEAAAARAHEHLADHRHGVARRVPERRVVDRYFAPAEQHLALVGDRAFDLAHARRARRGIARQEHHPHAVGARLRQLHLQARHLLPEEGVRNLDQHAGAVAVQGIGSGRAAVREVVEDREAVLDDVVRLAPLDVRDEAHAARVVLVARVVESLLQGRAGCAFHLDHLKRNGSRVPRDLQGARSRARFGLLAPATVRRQGHPARLLTIAVPMTADMGGPADSGETGPSYRSLRCTAI